MSETEQQLSQKKQAEIQRGTAHDRPTKQKYET